ncbi:hypothetical protein [Pseudarthrobacter sp. NIBRBAC000502771]|uniref:hypothetical protein n=1 Tax=Pseudarthrobacter sp. NIBRBAC000502771 TaxID=2590774 RepID=UPI0011321D70|nr:hypothetical protein [Pseudarthrobacter sp. NIBRBAC000502771]QDG61234.1 hypothetical protein NIBR502771_02200 [Pseudarthrobacter sp. NIBRBAC000502771]
MLTGQIGLRRHSTGWVGKCIEWATRSHTHHVVVAVSETVCISAEPGGARYRPITDYPSLVWSRFGLTTAQQDLIRDAAADYEGRPYNYAIYGPLLWQRITGRKVDGWVAQWLARRPNENCSQLSDDIYTLAGFHLFPDIPELVTPGDFERLFESLGWLETHSLTGVQQ